MVGAMVNNRIVPLDHELQHGDVVSIKTNKNSSGPSEDWLKIAKSPHAKHKIKAFLNKENRDQIVKIGMDLLQREMQLAKVETVLTDDMVKKMFEKNLIEDLDELYFEIGKNIISPKSVISKLTQPEFDRDTLIQRQMEKTSRQLIATSDTGVVVEGLTSPQIKLANCCTPIPGDEILGYVTKGSGIVIHASHCTNLKEYDKTVYSSILGTNVTRKYATWIKIIGTNRNGILNDIIQTVNSQGINIAEISAISNNQMENVIKLKISLNNLSELNALIANLHKVPQVYYVEREIR